MRVSRFVSGAVRQFSYWFAHGTPGYPLLEGIDYLGAVREESSFAEQAFAIFINNLEVDEEKGVLNYKYCERRAAEYIRSYFDGDYKPDKPFEDWECELHPVSRDSYSK